MSVQPLYAQAYVNLLGGQKDDARKALVKAAELQPSNPDPWVQLADFTLSQLNEPTEAMRLLGRALYLDPNSRQGATIYLSASRVAQQQADDRAQQQAERRKKSKRKP
jgi:tetratricopeptide (TPR) repeat protein